MTSLIWIDNLKVAMDSALRQMAKNQKIDIKVHVYVICWNEEVILPHFLKHYSFADKIIVYDNDSDDTSQELVKASSNGELRNYSTDGVLSDDRYLEIKNSVWKESRGEADFVIVCDSDEFLHHPDLPSVLREMKKRKASILWPAGYEMVGDHVPEPEDDLLSVMPMGMRLHSYDKSLLFDPNALEEINYKIGCHVCQPSGDVAYYRCPGLVMLHYKHLSPDYVWGRYEIYRNRMQAKDIQAGIAPHYQISRERLDLRYEVIRARKVDVIALAAKKAEDGKWKSEPKDLKSLFNQSLEFFVKGDLENAYVRLEDFADWRVERYFMHAALALIFSKKELDNRFDLQVQKSLNSAEEGYALERAVVLAENGSTEVDALLQVAKLFNQSGNFDLGLLCLKKAYRLEPERSDVLLKIAYISHKKGDFDKALNYCTQVIRKAPQNHAAYELAGHVLRELGRTEDAENFFSNAQRIREINQQS